MHVRLWAAALLLIATAACGQPEHQYVKNSDEGVYIRVPRGWHQVDQAEVDTLLLGDGTSLESQVQRDLTWSVAYDASDEPTMTHFFANSGQPIVYMRVDRLLPGLNGFKLPPGLERFAKQRDELSLNALRDWLLPVSEDERAAWAAQGFAATGTFELLEDEIVNPSKGLYGVHSVYNYKLGEDVQSFDLTALVDDKHSRLYVLMVRCTALCYQQRRNELAEIVSSFTVRGTG